jgi:hypothetical protein
MESSVIRRVPWTCRWSRFGGPVPATAVTKAGCVFWICNHPDHAPSTLLTQGRCGECPRWELAAAFKAR